MKAIHLDFSVSHPQGLDLAVKFAREDLLAPKNDTSSAQTPGKRLRVVPYI